MRKLLIRFLIKIQRKARISSLKKTIARAEKITNDTGIKTLIYFIEGQYEVFTKQNLRKLWHNKMFKDKTLQELEMMCELKITKK